MTWFAFITFAQKLNFDHLFKVNPLSAKPTKWPNRFKQFVEQS